jgi:uncharacterized protein with FMN-binding domain
LEDAVRRVVIALASTATGIAAILGLHSNRGATFPKAADRASSSGHPSDSSSPTTTSPTSSATTIPPTSLAGSAVGSSVQYGFGVLAVKVTVSGGRISDLVVQGLQVSEPYSQSLAEQAIPVLKNEVLAAQSTDVSAISGATYTSEAYLQSVQSALDQLHS